MRKCRFASNIGFAILWIFLLSFSSEIQIINGKEGVSSRMEEEKALPPPKNFKVTMATSEINIDGVLDEEAWEDAVVINLPYEWMPGDNITPPVDSECMVTFDKNKLYVAFRCFDPEPQKIRAHLMDRDAIDTYIQDDHVHIIIDPFNDERRGFQFRVNPLGVQADANFSELEGYEDFSWDAIWESAGKISDFGYAIEIAIPFNQLRFPQAQEKQTWGFSAGRSYPRNVRHRISSHVIDRNKSCILCQYNKLIGFQGMSPGHNLEFDPTLTSSRTDMREDFPEGKMEAGKVEAEPGITARWGVTPNLILNATVNPDFSQVEADVAQLDVNIRYVLRYPEKRPFFLEGADFFLTPVEAVFTRTVADPEWGFKITQKSGKNALGIFVTQDKINNLVFPSNMGSLSTSLDKKVIGGVFRYRRDVGRTSTLGFIYTGREGESYSNHVLGFDGFLRLSRTNTFSFQYLHSETDYPDEVALAYGQDMKWFGGNALEAEFLHQSRNWVLFANYKNMTPGFRADYGFIPRVDIRSAQGQVLHVFWGEPGGWFTQLRLGIIGIRTEAHDGTLTDQSIALITRYDGPLQSMLTIFASHNKEFFNEVTYDLSNLEVQLEIKPRGGLRLTFFGRYGDGIDYANSRAATLLTIMPGLEFNLSRNLNINLSHALQRLALGKGEIFEANLSQVRMIYHFNVRTFIRAIIQYTDVARNPVLYSFPVDPKSRQFFTQFLFSYKINPQTVLFLGYSDNYLGMTGIDITQKDKTFFVKVGYAWTL
ncbi:MAG: sugar-binding protein [Candidatus Aminicenantaceae bacterium]